MSCTLVNRAFPPIDTVLLVTSFTGISWPVITKGQEGPGCFNSVPRTLSILGRLPCLAVSRTQWNVSLLLPFPLSLDHDRVRGLVIHGCHETLRGVTLVVLTTVTRDTGRRGIENS